MDITIGKLNDNHLVFDTLKTNFNSALNIIKELEKKLSNQNASSKEERKKNKEIINKMRTDMKAKDQHIMELA